MSGKATEREPSRARNGYDGEEAPRKFSQARRQFEHAASRGRLALRRYDYVRTLIVRNRQRARPLNINFLRNIVRTLLIEELSQNEFEIGVSVVGEKAMTRMNEGYLRHEGSTDVITFDYSDAVSANAIQGGANVPASRLSLAGEIFVCLDEALAQARRFRVTWQNELVRYIVHGILHLCGYDDKTAVARRKMKREENRLMRRLAARFNLDQVRKPLMLQQPT